MKKFHFSKTYFNKTLFEDSKSKIRVVVNEIPSLEITEEDYSLRIETRHGEEKPIHRNYAIEHHSKQEKHRHPHVQFKFHTEEIGTFRIRLDFKDSEEYEKAILGFIYKIKSILENLEQYKKGITKEILVLELVNELSKEGDFLTQKLSESFDKYGFELNEPEKIGKLKNNPLLVSFLGENNIKKIEEN